MTRLEQLRKQQEEYDCLPDSLILMYAEIDICGCQVCPHDEKCNRLLNSIHSEEKLEKAMESLDKIIIDLEEA